MIKSVHLNKQVHSVLKLLFQCKEKSYMETLFPLCAEDEQCILENTLVITILNINLSRTVLYILAFSMSK
jgi:hypothetical protein